MVKKYYRPQTNIFDYERKLARSSNWYDKIWKTVKKCVFCDLKDRFIIFEKNGIVLTANLYPYTDAHLLIVPRRHIEYVKEMTCEEWEALRGVMYIAKKVLRRVFHKKNIWFLYREGVAGKGQKTVGHLHIHVIPYRKGLTQWNFKKINWAPGEVGDKLKDEIEYMNEKYKKYLIKYGKYTPIERRLVVNGVITNKKGEVLLVKKKWDNKGNTWETPAGSVEGDESLKDALERELKEETNIEIQKLRFINIYESKQRVVFKEGFSKVWNLIFINYKAEVKSGRIKPGDDVKIAKWVSLKDIKRYKISDVTKKILVKLKLYK